MGVLYIKNPATGTYEAVGAGIPVGLMSSRKKRASTSITLSGAGSAYQDIDNNLDLSIGAQIGDVLLVEVSGLAGSATAQGLGIDAFTIVSGSPVNAVSGLTASDAGFLWVGTGEAPFTGGCQYVVQAGDIVNGVVTLRLRAIKTNGNDRTIYATAGTGAPALQWSVVNLRGGAITGGPPRVTSNPTGVPIGYEICRTDIRGGMEFFYDGTRWLSKNEWSLNVATNPHISATTTWNAPIPGDYPIYAIAFDSTFYCGASYDWTIKAEGARWDESSYLLLATRGTSGSTTSKWYGYTDAVNVVVDGSGANSGTNLHGIYFSATKSSGNAVYFGMAVRYKLIAP